MYLAIAVNLSATRDNGEKLPPEFVSVDRAGGYPGRKSGYFHVKGVIAPLDIPQGQGDPTAISLVEVVLESLFTMLFRNFREIQLPGMHPILQLSTSQSNLPSRSSSLQPLVQLP